MKIPVNIFIVILGAISISVLVWWNISSPAIELTQSLPGKDNRKSSRPGTGEIVNIGAFFERFKESDETFEDSWPRFRGSDFDNIKKNGVKLIDTPDQAKTGIQWSVELGEGHAGPSVYKGLVYVLDYDEKAKADMLRCFTLKDGVEQWRRWYRVNVRRNHGMSRTIPAVSDEYILTIGPRGHVMCINRKTGDMIWGKDIEKDYASEIPFWYTGQCPLLENGRAIIATGGKALLIAMDCKTGKVIWESPNPDSWKMSHSSVMPWQFQGTRMYVYSAIGGVCGIAADGHEAGKILWKSSAWNCSVVAPSPVCLADGKIFLTAGYGAGSMVFQVTGKDGIFTVEKLYGYKPKDGLACEQQTPVFYRGMLYGILPKDAGTLRNQMVCVDPKDCRKIVWSSGKSVRFGLGPYIIADGKFYILNDDGVLSIVKPDREKFNLLGQARIFEAQDAWAPMAIADGYLILRDSRKMLCLDIRKR